MTYDMQASDGLLAQIEAQRNDIQERLDTQRTSLERNKMGQFATPAVLADDVMRAALRALPDSTVDFLEPSCGSGSFFSALLRTCDTRHQLNSAIGVELDDRFVEAARRLWSDRGLKVVAGDFIEFARNESAVANLLVANPPYVRHHHIDPHTKGVCSSEVRRQFGWKVSGLSGLYVYFVLLAHRLLRPGAVSAWLIPTEFMDVNYGAVLRRYLATEVSLLSIHRFDPADVQFEDALVSSAVVIFRNEKPKPGAIVDMSFGGTVQEPREVSSVRVEDLDPDTKWTRISLGQEASTGTGPVLSDFFKVQRGLATGSNKFFILPRSVTTELGFTSVALRPILPSPRGLGSLHVHADDDGWPLIDDQLALIDCSLREDELRDIDPALWSYLHGPGSDEVRSGYLVRKRSPWYKQEQRAPAPYLCTYMGRGVDIDKPFRFIRNDSLAVATNMYLMLYPRGEIGAALATDDALRGEVHRVLLDFTGEDLRLGGRVYGGGLHKIEPKELASLPADRLTGLLGSLIVPT